MHYIMSAIGSAGDVDPMVRIGSELSRRGHRVDFIASPYFEAAVAAAGLNLIPLGTVEMYHESLRDPELWHSFRGFAAVWRTLSLALADEHELACRHLVKGESRLIGTSLAFGTRMAGELHGVPMAAVHLWPACILSAQDVPRVPGAPDLRWLPLPLRRLFMMASDAVMLDPVCRADLNRLRRGYGLPPVKHVMTRWMHAPELVIGAFPDWFAPRQTDWPPNSVTTGFPVDVPDGSGQLPHHLESFLSAGERPLVFTAGTAMAHARRFFKTALDATAQLSMRAVFACRFPELLPDNLPASVLSVRYAPFALLFPRVGAVVHHGGIGTCAQALASGVPQLVTPFAHDQFDNAARLKALGAGETASPHADARAWVSLIESTMADRQGADTRALLKERIAAAHAVETIADRLEHLA